MSRDALHMIEQLVYGVGFATIVLLSTIGGVILIRGLLKELES